MFYLVFYCEMTIHHLITISSKADLLLCTNYGLEPDYSVYNCHEGLSHAKKTVNIKYKVIKNNVATGFTAVNTSTHSVL